MVWAALAIILGQGWLAALLLAVVRSFGAFTSDLRSFAAACIRTHDANVRIHEHNEYLVEEISKAARQMRRVSEALADRNFGIPNHPDDNGHHPNQEKSA